MGFESRSEWVQHFKTQHVDRPSKNLKCPHCDKRFAQKNHLTNHLKIHSAPSPSSDAFECSPCGRRFKNKTQLKLHRRMPDCLWKKRERAQPAVYRPEDEPAKCPVCNKKFQK